MNDIKILHYRIKYQDANVAVIRFSKKEINDVLSKAVIYTEIDEDYRHFWKCFADSLLEISGVLYVIAEGYEITVIKEPDFPNWGRIIEDVIWSSVIFLNPDGAAIEVSRNGKKIGKLIKQSFDAVDPQYWRKKQ